ncbi:MAG: SNF2-related protein [Myxococcota bacterium]|nr:SNF2-related protein [Myxococcota bacterium]
MMSQRIEVPNARGQLVWCPADPTLGIGMVTGVEGARVRVKFLRLEEERVYTTRRSDCVLLRYTIADGEQVHDHDNNEHQVAHLVGDNEDRVAVYELDNGESIPESELIPDVQDVGPKDRLANLNLVHPEVVRAKIRGLELDKVARRPGISAILGARVEWLPHQVDVATQALDSDPVRRLLADEVGLGKTVEAALIYAGLRHEGRAKRVLVLTPEALCIQWLGEFYRKTHELLVLLDDERLSDALTDFPDLSPFEAHQRVVASIESVAGDFSLRDQALAAPWDLVIVDEAHHLRWSAEDGGNDVYQLVEGLAKNTRHLLLLTATPMALDPAEYHALLRLLDPKRFDEPKAFEVIRSRVTSIREVAQQLRLAIDQSKPFSPELVERALEVLADDPEDQARFKVFAAHAPGAPEREVEAEDVITSLRQRHGLADYVVRNRRGPVGGLPQRLPRVEGLEPTELQSVLIDIGESVVIEMVSGISDPMERNRTMGRLLRALWATPGALMEIVRSVSPVLVEQLAPHIEQVLRAPLDDQGLPTGDSRLRWLVETIRRHPDEKLLVFVESSVAVRALKQALDQVLGADIAVFYRELPPRDQDRQVAWFRDSSGPQIMLSTEAGGEGRNFQFCHRVVLYDLPWRPATIEQRIGRVDRVGQKHDVEVLVPFFKSGYEAAILKVMQQSIGVLDYTVGGIDYALEYVSDRLAGLIYEGSEVDEWKELYRDTSRLVSEARATINEAADPVLDNASFSPERADSILEAVPEDLEARMESFIKRYASHSRLDVAPKTGPLYAVEGAPGAAGESGMTGYVATFSRTHALGHEDVELLSFGHPLVEDALEWAKESFDNSAALAVIRGMGKEGAAFLWRYGLTVPDDAADVLAYFDSGSVTVVLDESGKRQPELEDILDDPDREFSRMDAKPLRPNVDRWRALIEHNYEQAKVVVDGRLDDEISSAEARLHAALDARERELLRHQTRQRVQLEMGLGATEDLDAASSELEHAQGEERAAFAEERERFVRGVRNAHYSLQAALGLRLVRERQVSA